MNYRIHTQLHSYQIVFLEEHWKCKYPTNRDSFSLLLTSKLTACFKLRILNKNPRYRFTKLSISTTKIQSH